MPAKIDKKVVTKKYDKRIKLSSTDKLNIVSLYSTGDYSQRQLANLFNVSRRLIQFVLDPQKQIENKALRDSKGGSKQYYDTKKNTIAMAKHREYKKKLEKQGLI